MITTATQRNTPGRRRALGTAAALASALLVLSACSPAEDVVEEEVDAADIEVVEEEPQGPADGGLSAVADMCDLLVAPAAPAPPELLPEESGGPETWGAFFDDLGEYMVEIAPIVNAINEETATELTQAATEDFIAAALTLAPIVDGIRGIPAKFPAVAEIESSWSETQDSLGSMCPQFTRDAWPYQAAAYEALPAREWRTLDERGWALIARDPEASRGELVVVYGVITQYDVNTGLEQFRADVGHRRERRAFNYPTNTYLYGDPEMFAELIEGDIFKAEVTVFGSLQYDTAIGGTATAVVVAVDSIERIGRR